MAWGSNGRATVVMLKPLKSAAPADLVSTLLLGYTLQHSNHDLLEYWIQSRQKNSINKKVVLNMNLSGW